jgi:gas vesicle protein
MENSNETGKLIGVLIIGAAVGAALGVLFAPDKGCNTRKKLMGKAKDLAEDVKQKMLEEANAFRARAEELEAMVEGKINDVSHNMNQNLDL